MAPDGEYHKRVSDLRELRTFLRRLEERTERERDPLTRAGWRAQQIAVAAEIRRLIGLLRELRRAA